MPATAPLLLAWQCALTLRAVFAATHERLVRRAGNRGLSPKLGRATRDANVRRRSKQARDWPHKKTQRPPATRTIRVATSAEKAAPRQIRQHTAAA